MLLIGTICIIIPVTKSVFSIFYLCFVLEYVINIQSYKKLGTQKSYILGFTAMDFDLKINVEPLVFYAPSYI